MVGLGFGPTSEAFSLVYVLAASLSPGTLGFNGEPHNFFIVSAIMTLCIVLLCIVLLHTSWWVIFFSSLDTGNLKNIRFLRFNWIIQEPIGRLALWLSFAYSYPACLS